MRALAGLLLVAGGSWSCQDEARPPDEPAHSSVASAPIPQPPAKSQPPAARPTAELNLPPAEFAWNDVEPRAASDEAPRILEPAERALVKLSQVERQRVRVTGVAKDSRIRIVLDDHAPRDVDTARLSLTDLHLEDVEIGPGLHRLVAVEDSADGMRGVAQRWFWVGDDEREISLRAIPETSVVLLSPSGTYNGEQSAERIVVDALVLSSKGAMRAPLDYAVARKFFAPLWKSRHAVETGHPVRLAGLPSGDYAIRATVASTGGQSAAKEAPAKKAPPADDDTSPWLSAERIITVNRDAPVASGGS